MKNKEVLILRCLVGLLLLWLVLSFLKYNSQRNFDSSTLTKKETENVEIQHAKDLLQSKYDNVLNRVKSDSIKSIASAKQLEQMKKQAVQNQAKLKLFDSGEIAMFYKERYELWNEVKTTANGTEVSDTVGIKIISDLVAGDDAINQLRFTNEILKDCELTSKRKDTLINNCEKRVLLTEKQYGNSLIDNYILKTENSKLKAENNREVKFRLLGGLEYGNNVTLSNSIFKANLSGQNRKGNIYRFSVDNNKNYYIGYDFSIFSIKGKKK